MKNITAITRSQLCTFGSSEGCWATECARTYSIYLTSSLFSHMTKTEHEGPSKSVANIYTELSTLLWRQEIIRRLMYTEYVPNTAFSIKHFKCCNPCGTKGKSLPQTDIFSYDHAVCALSIGQWHIQILILRELVFGKNTRQTWEDAEEQRWHLALASTPHQRQLALHSHASVLN